MRASTVKNKKNEITIQELEIQSRLGTRNKMREEKEKNLIRK